MRVASSSLAFALSSALHAQTPCVNGMAGPYPCANVDLMATLTVAQLGSSVNAADIWGWTDPLTQKEYAIIGLRTGTAFVDLSTPTAPVVTGFLPSHITGTNTLWRDVDVAGNWCYVGSETSGHGLQVFDLTRLRTAVPTASFTEDAWYGGFSNSHTIYADKTQPYVYAVGTNTASGGLHVVNVSNPLAPVIAGTFSTSGYIHENVVVLYNGPDVAHVGQHISVNFHSGTPDKFTIVDVSDKSDMQLISATTYSGSSICHQGWLTADHRYLLMDDEGDEAAFGHNTRTRVFDVADLELPVFVGFYSGPNASSDHNLYVHNDLCYQANYTSCLRFVDLAGVGSVSLTQSGSFDTYTASNNNSYNGAWGNFPFFNSGLVVVSNYGEGLFILRPKLSLRVKALLEGPLDAISGVMHDSLRVKGLLPLTEPYTALGYTHVNGGGGETTSAPVLATAGNDAIVDWVVIELRDATNAALVVATHAALLQRDGDIVGTDGTSPLQFSLPVKDYYIAVRHRNHLGIMTAAPVRVSIAERSYDLSSLFLTLYGTQATKAVGAARALWAGNVKRDTELKYTGSNNDRDQILLAIGGVVPTNTSMGYAQTDVNMDGVTKYTGLLNDRDPLLLNIGSVLPTNTRQEQLP